MTAPETMAESMSVAHQTGKSGLWQYHSRSDRHSKVSCWAVLFDLLQASPLMRQHVTAGKIAFGVNHPLRDFVNNKKKNLDLVVCTPGTQPVASPRDLKTLAATWGVVLTPAEQTALANLPVMHEASVGGLLVALEAKACMTAHGKAAPRFYDELNSSHQIVHASSNNALSIGLATINIGTEFISFDRNKYVNPALRVNVSKHKQPDNAEKSLDTVMQLPRRSGTTGNGYDGLGVVLLDLRNDFGPVKLVTASPAPQPGDVLHYESMLARMVSEYAARFAQL